MNIITPVFKRFLCQHRNGDTFATDPTTDFVPYVQGSVLEKLKLIARFEVQTVTSASSSVLINAVTDGSYVKLTHPFNNWENEGFVEGNAIYVDNANGNVTGTVNIIFNNEMWITSANFFTNLAITSGDDQADLNIYVTTVPTTARFYFGLRPSTDKSKNPYGSLLNGEPQLYTGSGLTTSPVSLTYNGTQATDLGYATVEYVSASGTGNSVFLFELAHIFRVPHFIDGWLTNYLTGSIPSEFQGDNSLNYVFSINFGNNLNNPNNGKVFKGFGQLGSIGFIGQNFNTSVVDYTLNSNAITIDGDTATAPEITKTNVFAAQIERASANFSAGVKAYLYVTKLPTEEEYTDASRTYEENFVLDQLDVLEGAGTSSSTIINEFEVNIPGGTGDTLDVDFEITWTTAQQALFNSGDNIFIGLAIEDGTKDADVSDRTMVEIYSGTVTKDGDISGLISNQQIDVYDTSDNLSTATPTSNFNTWNNRAYILKGSFRNLKEAGGANSLIQNFKVQVVARIPDTTTFFKLSEYIFPFSTGDVKFPTVNVGGTQYQTTQINTTRPIGHANDDSDLRGARLVAGIPVSFQAYQQWNWQLGIEIPHREWIQNLEAQTVASEFFDATLADEFYNFNERSSNYSSINGYEIYVFAITDILYEGISTRYAMATDTCYVADFDEALIQQWSAETKYYDINDIEIDTLYEGEDAKVEVTFTHPADGTSFADAEVVFEYYNDNGETNRLSSEVDWSREDNALEGETGSLTVVSVDRPSTTTTVVTCVIKGEYLFDGTAINTMGHLLKLGT